MEDVEDVEMPSRKRSRVERSNSEASPDPSKDVDDFDDIYGTPPMAEEEAATGSSAFSISAKNESPSTGSRPPLPDLPGLGISQDHSRPADDIAQLQVQEPGNKLFEKVAPAVQMADEVDDGPQINNDMNDRETLEETAAPVEQGIPELVEQTDSGADLGHTGQVQRNRVNPSSAMSEAPQNVTDESVSAAVEMGSFDSVRGETAKSQAERKESIEASNGDLPLQSLLQSPEVESSVQDPLAFLEASLPPATSREINPEAVNQTNSQAKIGTGAKPMIEATAPEYLSNIGKHNTDAEFELDSSPLNSDTDMSDSSSNSSSSDDDADDYKMLDPEEQARRLMAEDGGSDDEGGGGKGKASGPLRTQNEKPDEDVPKPDVMITEEMRIEELGSVEGTVENLVLIKAKTSGEYQVLEQGSVLCLEDRSVIGVIAETLGRVQQPYYSVRFTNAAAISEAGLVKDTKILYVEQYSTPVFTQPLKAFKGSDASNLHDEEVGDDELEFSDDEAEAEYKRRVKVHKQQKRMGRDGQNEGFSRGPRGGRGGMSRGGGRGRPSHSQSGLAGASKVQEQAPNPAERGLNYDDGGNDMSVDAEDLYTPLARPTNLHEMIQSPGMPTVNSGPQRSGERGGHSRGRGRGDRGGGSRGFGRGRGQVSGGSGNRGGHPSPNSFQLTPTNSLPPWPSPQANGFDTTAAPPQQNNYMAAMPNQQQPYPSFQGQYSPQWNHDPAFQYPPHHQQHSPSGYPAQYQNQYQNQQQQQQQFPPYTQPPFSQVPSPSTPSIPPGAYVNPAFFGQSQQQWPPNHQHHHQHPQ